MITEYVGEALRRAKFELIEDDEPYYGEVLELKGVWATGKTLEECRQNLAEVIDGWLVIRLRKGLAIPPLGSDGVGYSLNLLIAGEFSCSHRKNRRSRRRCWRGVRDDAPPGLPPIRLRSGQASFPHGWTGMVRKFDLYQSLFSK